jgi:predicted RND superfamily exporter protein
MEIVLEFGKAGALKDPEVLTVMDDLQHMLEMEHAAFVAKTESLVNVAKEAFQVLNENRADMYRIPRDGSMLAQTLLLYEAADPDKRARLASDDYSLGRISARLYNYGSAEYVRFFDDVQRQTEEGFAPLRGRYPELHTSITGSLALLMRVADYISYSQIRSFGLAWLVVTVLLFVVFGSFKVGLVAMVPNVLPVLTTFGVMGWIGIPLDTDTLILAPIIIGIAVDDTIHFITHYRAGFIRTGRADEAIRISLKEAGQAITFTTVILVLGFLVLVPSSHLGMANLGFLTAVAFATALAADLVLLPSLCVLLKVRFAG